MIVKRIKDCLKSYSLDKTNLINLKLTELFFAGDRRKDHLKLYSLKKMSKN